jgi:hypothetical protein
VTPHAAASRSIDGVHHAGGDQQPQPRQLAQPLASNGVRSRIATMTSYGSSARTSASVRPMCSVNTSISARPHRGPVRAGQGNLLIVIQDRDPHGPTLSVQPARLATVSP